MEGASGEEGKFAAMPKPPSGRKTLPGRGEMSRKRQSGEQWHGASRDGRSYFGPSYCKRGLLQQKGTFHAYPDL